MHSIWWALKLTSGCWVSAIDWWQCDHNWSACLLLQCSQTFWVSAFGTNAEAFLHRQRGWQGPQGCQESIALGIQDFGRYSVTWLSFLILLWIRMKVMAKHKSVSSAFSSSHFFLSSKSKSSSSSPLSNIVHHPCDHHCHYYHHPQQKHRHRPSSTIIIHHHPPSSIIIPHHPSSSIIDHHDHWHHTVVTSGSSIITVVTCYAHDHLHTTMMDNTILVLVSWLLNLLSSLNCYYL